MNCPPSKTGRESSSRAGGKTELGLRFRKSFWAWHGAEMLPHTRQSFTPVEPKFTGEQMR